jgi:hypothetical protein
MEGGNATDGAGGTDETGQGEPMRESPPTSPTRTARSTEESNLPFGLGRGHIEKHVKRVKNRSKRKRTH